MGKDLKILGNGQIWNVRGISPTAPEKTFEDLFSGRALAEMARGGNGHGLKVRKVFSRFKENGRITGLSVSRALLSNNQQAKKTAMILFEDLAKNAARGIEALSRGKGFKPNWSAQERNYWRNLNVIIIGGGVFEGVSGKLLVGLVKKHLSKIDLLDSQVYQAKFPGKEAGFLGGLINIRSIICKEGKKKGLKKVAAIGLDLGRDEIGVGLLAINPTSEEIALRRKKQPWLFKYSVKTPYPRYLKAFLDSRRNYTKKERAIGERIRASILKKMVNLIILAQAKAQKLGLVSSQNIGVAIPGRIFRSYIIDSTDYLPFFRKQDGFNFARTLRELLVKEGMKDCRIHIINDGIAAGIANVYGVKAKKGKFAFFGVGSGLGGCVGLIRRENWHSK